jgi:hypothetical protein
VRHVRRFKFMFADTAASASVTSDRCRLTGDVIPPTGEDGDDGRQYESQRQRNERRKRLSKRAKCAGEGGNRYNRGNQHRPDAHRVDVVQMCTFKLDIRRTQAKRFIDDQIRNQGTYPGDGDIGIKAKYLLENTEDAKFH